MLLIVLKYLCNKAKLNLLSNNTLLALHNYSSFTYVKTVAIGINFMIRYRISVSP
ncbi:hypothetical protein [Fowlpox virus]|uniref:Uncharacterized protein n=1 Tax=Fowlpox virus TaxID=10261 RepID=A0A891LXP5_FOWPV|nr:hypothetical protein [Fowlpox virus]UNS14324.1 ALPV-160 [Albatrosspox virus]UQT20414.1 hypothetical protein [Fowlpox virus]UQT20655.1 hypothetical protein [Fowlpox virus]WPD90823.1 hypothetical protein PPV_Vac110-(116-117)n1 [Avipoxvirus sp.]